MKVPGAPTPGSARRAILALLAAASMLGCVRQERTASFRLHEQIPLGVIAITVDGWEQVGQAHAPLSSLRAEEGRKTIAAFIGWSGLDEYKEPDRQLFVDKFLQRRLKLADSNGSEYEAADAMPREIYFFSGELPPAPRDWVLVFHVPADTVPDTLRVTHPDPRQETFEVGVVPLG